MRKNARIFQPFFYILPVISGLSYGNQLLWMTDMLFFKKRNRRDHIALGDIFFRPMNLSMQEQAKVLRISEDDQGIPHVHYEKTLLCSGHREHGGNKVLALSTFERQFRAAQ